MEKITFINSKGQSIQLGNDGPFILTKIEGTGAVNVDIQTQKSPYQDGESYIGNTLEPRPLSIEVMVLAENLHEMAKHRHKLLQVFNPKLEQGKLIYQLGNIKREIKAISELAPVFPDAEDFKDSMQPGLIQLYCPNPFWEDLEEGKEEIALWISDWEFPVDIPAEGMEFGHRATTLIKNIINNGDVPCGMRIEFKALATVVNPSIFDFNTREFIKVKRNLLAGEKLIINTSFGNKRVELMKSNGTIENVFHYIDLKSTFIQLDVGDNLIQYDAEEGIDNLEVSIYHKPLYIGV